MTSAQEGKWIQICSRSTKASTSTRIASTKRKPHKLNQDFPDFPFFFPSAELWPVLSSIPKTTAPKCHESGVCQENKMIPHFSLEPEDKHCWDRERRGAGTIWRTSVWFIAWTFVWAGAHRDLMDSSQQATKVTVYAEDVALAWSPAGKALCVACCWRVLPRASKETGSPIQFLSNSWQQGSHRTLSCYQKHPALPCIMTNPWWQAGQQNEAWSMSKICAPQDCYT